MSDLRYSPLNLDSTGPLGTYIFDNEREETKRLGVLFADIVAEGFMI